MNESSTARVAAKQFNQGVDRSTGEAVRQECCVPGARRKAHRRCAEDWERCRRMQGSWRQGRVM